MVYEEDTLADAYRRITEAQTVLWQGRETNLRALSAWSEDPNRRVRERVWRLAAARRLQAREAIQDLWQRLLQRRHQGARDAGFANYRDYRWQQLARSDYTPEDCLRLHYAIEEWVTPVMVRLHEERRVQLGLRRLQPWDLQVDPAGRLPLPSITAEDDLIHGVTQIIRRLQPGSDGESKALPATIYEALAGQCVALPSFRSPFIVLDGGAIQTDLAGLFHALGHTVPAEAAAGHQEMPAELVEMAATAIELLAMAQLGAGELYDPAETARVQRDHLIHRILSALPLATMIDAFEHWAYTHVEDAVDPGVCGRQWRSLWLRFLPGVDWSGLDGELAADWQQHRHLFLQPFSSLAYALGLLGAIQVWAAGRHDPAGAMASLGTALSSGPARSLPHRYAAAGARLAFDEHTIREAMDALEASGISHLTPDP